ncbi:FtsX-like permease family protein [Ruegeria pomeroyi]|uniref:FtsX-like permease family protein n=1 Tax=Ruegeria alba TaxID=2916756 RepID=A0ABS9NZX2_9RHOB|nr:FtsX-like permease family protein [Ruegeria alba]MCE8533590.1 FtsX-like permease family protein [Ruegeria pomeroyi]MCG6559783.1 FtsX-like permease family protein [Ruegeria alba]
MSPLSIKLGRDLWRIKGQAVAIALVVAVGVLLQVMQTGLVRSLDETRRAYYERYRLAEVFAPVTRAPVHAAVDLRKIDGVAAVETRVAGAAMVDLPGAAVPVRAQVASLPAQGAPRLNDVLLTDGRALSGERPDEILLLQSFARAHGLKPGDRISATMNGARHDFTVSGLAVSPEFIYTTAPGELVPDDRRFAVLWMTRTALEAAFDMDGAFNEALLSLSRGTEPDAVMAEVDRLLDRYGGTGAYHLDDLPSNKFVVEEISGIKRTSKTVPPVFMAVAAFLLYIVISRLVDAERKEIGLMKAFGYTSWEVGVHYLKMVLVIAVGGAVLGSVLGVLAGRWSVNVYMLYYKFPFLVFRLDPPSFAIGFGVSVLAASAGGLLVLRRVFALTPAVAMRAAAPADYSRARPLGGWLGRVLDQPTRMVLRRLTRQPLRMGGAIAGVGAATALGAAMASLLAAYDAMVETSFGVIDRSDVTVTFTHPIAEQSRYDLASIPGVIEVEPIRIVSAVLRNGRHSYRGAVNGMAEAPRLYRAVDADMTDIPIRRDGIILSTGLARELEIEAGDRLILDVREGRRPIVEVPVSGVSESLIGSPAYMEIGALNRLLKEPLRISGAFLRVDPAQGDSVYRILKDRPMVAGVALKSESRAALRKMMDQGAGAMRYVMAVIAGVITFGVIYNAARVAQAERERDLAGLRVLGFTRGEVAFVLLGELAAVVVLAMPLGALGGYWLNLAISAGFSTDLYQIPASFGLTGFGQAMIVVLIAALLSGWLVKRDIDRTDLILALKNRE